MPGLPLAVFALVCVHPSAAPPPAVGRDTLDRLLAEYRALGLPLPAAGTRLGRTTGIKTYYLVAPAGDTRESLVARYGYGLNSIGPVNHDYVAPTAAVADEIVASGRASPEFAVQCHALGWTSFALRLLSSPSVPTEREMVKSLRSESFFQWYQRIDDEGSDWKLIAARMQHLLVIEPSLGKPYYRDLVREMIRAAEPTGAIPGSDRAFIDGLIEVSRCEEFALYAKLPFSQADSYDRAIRRGFAVVPALIAALDDTRRTRSSRVSMDTYVRFPFEVRHLASEMLVEIAGIDPDGTPPLTRRGEISLSKADAEAWWAKARKVGEEKYAVERVFGKEREYADSYQLAVLADRYPRRLPALFREALKGGRKLHSVRALVAAVQASSLPRKEKLALFNEAAKSNNVLDRFAAASSLRVLDAPAWRELVLREFRKMPKDVTGADHRAAVFGFASQVSGLDDPADWEVFADSCRRADVSMRMELLRAAGWVDVPTVARHKRRLAFLTSFLGDSDVRKIEEDSGRLFTSYSNYPTLSVGDFAALLLAKLLAIDVAHDPERTPAEWATLRERVRKSVADAVK